MNFSPLDFAAKEFPPVLWISFHASIVALLVFIVQFALRKHLPPRWRYALWFLVVLRLVLPALPESPFSLQRLWPEKSKEAPPALPVAAVSLDVPSSSSRVEDDSLSSMRGDSPKITGVQIFGVLWLAGMFALSAGVLVLVGRFRWRLRPFRPCAPNEPVTQLLAACASMMGIKRLPRLIKTPLVSTPAVGGIFRPSLLLPADFEEIFSGEEQRMIFLHELAHIRRGDLWLNPLLTVLQVIHWFNPVLWLAFRRLKFDRECATDSLVLSGERAGLKTMYAHTLLKLVESISTSPTRPRMVGIIEEKNLLHERFRMIKFATPGAYGFSALGLIVLGALGIVTLTRSSSVAAEAPGAGAKTGPPADSPELSLHATKDEVRAYVAAVLKDVSPFANSSLKDPQIDALKKVGADNIDILIEANANYSSFGSRNPTTNYYLSMAVCALARPQDQALVVNALPKNRYLVYTVLKMNWAPAAREELLRVFRSEPGQFAPGWIEAIASLHDPSTYEELKNYLITGRQREITYKTLKKIPDIGDLQETVAKAWPPAKNAGGYEARDMAKIAAQYGIADAIVYRKSHSDPSEKGGQKKP